MKTLLLLLALTACVCVASQPPLFWHRKHVGHVTAAIRLSSNSIVVGSSWAVAELDASGNIKWRRTLEATLDGGVAVLLKPNKSVSKAKKELSVKAYTVSTNGQFVRQWLAGGAFGWESVLDKSCATADDGSVEALIDEENRLIVRSGLCLRAIDASTGQTLWESNIPALAVTRTEGVMRITASSALSVALTAARTSEVVITTFKLATGEYASSHTIPTLEPVTYFPVATEDAALVVATVETLLTLRMSGAATEFAGAPISQYLSPDCLKTCLRQGCKPTVHNGPGLNIITVRAGSCQVLLTPLLDGDVFKKLYELPVNTTGAVAMVDDDRFVRVQGECDGLAVHSRSHGQQLLGSAVPIVNHRRSTLVLPVHNEGTSVSALCVLDDASLSLIEVNGELSRVVWTLEEAISETLFVEFAEPAIPHQTLAVLKSEFGSSHEPGSNVFTQMIARARGQLASLQQLLFPASHSHDHLSKSDQIADAEAAALPRDYFLLRKAIVLATRFGVLFGLRSDTGSLLWRLDLGHFVPHGLYIQRGSSHGAAVMTVVGLGEDGRWRVFIFDPLTGTACQTIDATVNDDLGMDAYGATVLNYKVQQAILLPGHSQILLLVGTDHHARVIPNLEEARYQVQNGSHAVYGYTVDKRVGSLLGFQLGEWNGVTFSTNPTWSVKFDSTQEVLVAAATKPASEKIHSVGRMKGDRNLLYKYLNPTLIAFVTESVEENELTVFALDTVKGNILLRSTLHQAAGPVSIAQSENWLIVTYENVHDHRSQLNVWDLYTTQKVAENPLHSSFDFVLPQTNYTQSFVLTSPVKAIGVTKTLTGITTKGVLLGFANGHILLLGKNVLDPRRPLIAPTPEDAEEILAQYDPFLPIVFTRTINANVTIPGLNQLVTTATGLESTSLVVAVGRDLLVTKATPSGAFDTLNDDFNKPLLATVTIGLFVATVVTWHLREAAILKRQWL